ncbi:MAG: efflux RND transporter periplasmic adaptor subunit [bacterium]|nr:efflux RND transporter periplasmic adaptor subunit [bacterium]
MKVPQGLIATVLISCGWMGFVACDRAPSDPPASEATTASCEDHGVERCPFCDPSLLVTMGFCGGHGVPEAICTRCRDDLEQAFRDEGDWCDGHALPESQCEACNPGVLDKWKGAANQTASTHADGPCSEHSVTKCPFCSPSVLESMGFCGGHGVPEAVCTKCRDDLEQAFRDEGDWCDGHGLPESQCEACNPGALEKFEKYKSSRAEPHADDPTPEIVVVTVDTPRVQRPPSLTCSTDASVVRLAEAAVAERVGLRTEQVRRAKLRRTLEVPATVEYDSRSHARLAPRAAGTVVEVRHDLGAVVEAGDTLVVVDCAALATAKADVLQAAAQVELWKRTSERERGLLEKSLSTERDALEAETTLAESEIALAIAEQRLVNLGLSAEQIGEVTDEGDTSSLLTVRAPFEGTVIELDAVIGELATPQAPIVSVADTSRMWVILDVDQADIRLVDVGQPVLLTVEGWEGETVGGRITWISSHVDPRSRTVKVRSEFVNPEGHLRAQSFGSAKVITRDDEEVFLVPKAAVQWEGCCNVAFEQRSPTEYIPRKLRLGYDAGEHYEVLRGLTGNETVVTQGSFILKTELQKGSIGAGCCEVDHLSQ